MFIVVMLVLSTAMPDEPERHVRTTERPIQALIDQGSLRSTTFLRLLTTLDQSDVIVYIEPQLTRPALGGFLVNHISRAGGRRYLRVAVDYRGSPERVIAVLGHELQHALEIATDASVEDDESLQQMIGRRAIAFGCGSTECYETEAAKEVEKTVLKELKQSRVASAR